MPCWHQPYCCVMLQNKVTHAPHAALKSQPCPREGCRGRVKEVVRVTQTKRKKELEAILDAPPAIPVPTPKPSGRGRKAHQAPAASQVTMTSIHPLSQRHLHTATWPSWPSLAKLRLHMQLEFKCILLCERHSVLVMRL